MKKNVNRNLSMLMTFNSVERNHWQLMADLSNNDYDVSYFGGRATINDEFNNFLYYYVGEFDISYVIDWLNDTLIDCNEELKENNHENFQGCIDECCFLLQFVHQDYLIFNEEEKEDGQGNEGETE